MHPDNLYQPQVTFLMQPPESGNLGDIFELHRYSDQTAIIDLSDPLDPREYSYREFDTACDSVANGLLCTGLQSGDRVGILALNRVGFLEVLFGAMRAGCVPVMINLKLPDDTVDYIIRDSGAKLVFAESDQVDRVTPGVRVIDFDDGEDSYSRFCIEAGEPFPSFFPGRGDIAEQPYTSGSTGRPKGVLLDHLGQVWMTAQAGRNARHSPGRLFGCRGAALSQECPARSEVCVGSRRPCGTVQPVRTQKTIFAPSNVTG